MRSLRLDIGTPAGGAFQILLEPGEVELGRSAACAVRLPYPSVSSRHLQLSTTSGGWTVTDLGSKNGTVLDGRPLPPSHAVSLEDGAVLQIADVTITAALTDETTEGFTLTESGTMLRKLVAESTGDVGAYLRTKEGARIDVPDFASALQPAESTPFLIDRRGHGFWLTPLSETTVNGAEVGRDGVALDDGCRIEGGGTWTFHDPLQDLVDELEDEVDEPQTVRHAPVRPARTVDRALLIVGVTTVVLSVVALLVVFEIV